MLNFKHFPMHLLCFSCLLVLFLSSCTEQQVPKEGAAPIQVLSSDSGYFQQPNRQHKLQFPQVHTPQRKYQQEWWYLTANLSTESGESLATQWTLFRRGVADKHWYFAHGALANKSEHIAAYRNGREELNTVSFTKQPFSAQINDWRWQSNSADLFPASLYFASGAGFPVNSTQINTIQHQVGEEDHITPDDNYWRVELQLERNLTATTCAYDNYWQLPKMDNKTIEEKPPSLFDYCYFLQGDNGYSQKHQQLDIASYYYSQPFIRVSGRVYWQNRWQKVSGNAWFDREWGSQLLAKNQRGWDWFSLRLNNDLTLMLFQIRDDKASFRYGRLMRRDGKMIKIAASNIIIDEQEPLAKINSRYPEQFRIRINSQQIDIQVKVINNKQIMRYGIEYFEGMVSLSGSHQGTGFLEMTGYEH